MEALSKIVNEALHEITGCKFPNLPRLAITGLLDDFQYAWLGRLEIPYDFKALDIARTLCSGGDKAAFKATQCKSVEDVRKSFAAYIKKRHRSDDRVILGLSFDGKAINTEWLEMKEYLDANITNTINGQIPD